MKRSKSILAWFLVVIGLAIVITPMYIVSSITERNPDCDTEGNFIGSGFCSDCCFSWTDRAIGHSPTILLGSFLLFIGVVGIIKTARGK